MTSNSFMVWFKCMDARDFGLINSIGITKLIKNALLIMMIN